MRVLRPLVLSLLLVLGGGITALSAQNREVSGKVLDANQQPLVGVAVLVDGTTKGVTTSENGTFKIQVPSGEAVLQVTCLGYLPQKVTVPSSRNSITIYLQEDAIMLDATVVIGYGTQKKVNLTGAVATVGSKELENRVTHSLGSMLQGSVAGLNITTSSGKPGQHAGDQHPRRQLDQLGRPARADRRRGGRPEPRQPQRRGVDLGHQGRFGGSRLRRPRSLRRHPGHHQERLGPRRQGDGALQRPFRLGGGHDLDRLREPRLLVGLYGQQVLAGRLRNEPMSNTTITTCSSCWRA